MTLKQLLSSVFIVSLAFSLAAHPSPSMSASLSLPGVESASETVSLPEGVSESWWAQAQQFIQGSEYEITWQEGTFLPGLPAAYQAPNRAQGLRAYFTPQGIQVIAREETEPTWQLGLSLANISAGGEPQGIPEAGLSVAANRIDYDRGSLSEWYLNSELGLEHGISLPTSDTTVTLDLSIEGNLTPAMYIDGDAVEFFTAEGELVAKYALQAVDSDGGSDDVQLSLFQDETKGRYTLRLALSPSSQSINFTFLLTSPLGSAGSPENIKIFPPSWTANGEHADDWFGFSVASAGDVNADGYGDIIIGAFAYDENGVDRGKVYVWYGSTNGLSANPSWVKTGEAAGNSFGISVSTAGDVNNDGVDDIIVGAQWKTEDIGHGPARGAAYVFHGPLTYNESYVWKAEPANKAFWFASRVSEAGDVNGDGYADVIVAAAEYDNGDNDEGAVFVWHGSAYGLCDTNVAQCEETTIDDHKVGEGNQVSATLGWSIGAAGDINGDGLDDILAGAPHYDDGTADNGRVYVWLSSGDTFQSPVILTGAGYGARFGWSVDGAGDVNGDGYADVGIGSIGAHVSWGGAVYVKYGSPSGLQPDGWVFYSESINTSLGSAVSTAGDVNGDGYDDILVGARNYENSAGNPDEGAAYVWYGSADGMGLPDRPADWKYEYNHAYDYLGDSVSTAGDVNGDGLSDILIGAHGWEAPGSPYDYGMAFVFHGSASGPLLWSGNINLSPQAGAEFGYSVAGAGDVNGDGYSDIMVGARKYDEGWGDRGKVYAWYGFEGGWCQHPAENCRPDWSALGEYGTLFGEAVSTAGDVNADGFDDVVIGARYFDQGIEVGYEGAAYLYYGSSEGLQADYAWRVESDRYATDLGYSVSTAGDVNGDGYDDVIVGAPNYEYDHTDEGAAFVFYGSAHGLCETDTVPCQEHILIGDPDQDPSLMYEWYYESNQVSALLGYSVASAGDVNGDGYCDVLIGSPLYDYEGLGDRGLAMLVYGASTGLGKGLVSVNIYSDQAASSFGNSVDTAGDVNGDGYSDIVVGAIAYDAAWVASTGSVNVYSGGDSGVVISPTWQAVGYQVWTEVGSAVSTAGDMNGDGYADIVVGARGYEGGLVDEGAVLIWYGSKDGMGAYNRQPDWLFEGEQTSGLLGYSVAEAGDINGDGYGDILAGASAFDLNGADAGRVDIFYGSGQGPDKLSSNWISGTQANAQFGYAVNTAGDVNGDGFGDVILGAPYFDDPVNAQELGEGRVYVYMGDPTGIITTTSWVAESNQANANLGEAVASAGDVNGDGYGDVIAGAPGYSNGQNNEGAAFVWSGSPIGMGSPGDPSTADWQIESNVDSARLGSAVASAGDVNGDGYGDVIVGAKGYNGGLANEGWAGVYLGGPDGLAETPTWTRQGGLGEAGFGNSVSSAGDINGDGYGDVLVGAYKFSNGQTNEGRVYLYYGTYYSLSTVPAWTAESNQDQAFFGASVSGAGDVNGDGYSDIIVGASQYQTGQSYDDQDDGAVFAWYGSSNGLGEAGVPENADWKAFGNSYFSRFGASVSGVGDVNGDGYCDVIAGALSFHNGPESEGRIFIFNGSENGLRLTPGWTAEGDQGGAELGTSVAGVGDVTGDGFADVIAGAPKYNAGNTSDVGSVRIYNGNGANAFVLQLRQMQTDGATPIAPLGMSDSETEARLHLTARMPLGREDVKLEWQVALVGTAFTAPTTIRGISPGWVDTGIGGAEFDIDVTGLTPGTRYMWRVRLVYSGNALGLGASRWISGVWNGPLELDFRSFGEKPPPPPPPGPYLIYLPVTTR